MLAKDVLIGLLSLAVAAEATVIAKPFENLMARRASRTLEVRQNRNNGQNRGGAANGGNAGNAGNGGNNNAAAGNNCLAANAVQTGSANPGNSQEEAGRTASKTDANNFINFCSGKTLTNGLQTQGGSCNGIPMGNIPAKANMIAAVFRNPQNGQNIAANTAFDISVQTVNLAAGTFTDPDETYYSAPQDLDGSGKVIGHTHVVVQDMGNSLNPTQPPSAGTFAFFKGINDKGNGNGLLTANVAGGLPAGNYRLCSMTGSSNHQPVLMPVAQRGPQDDCIRFTVGGNGGGNAGNNAGNNAGGNAGNNAGNNAGGNQAGRGGKRNRQRP